MSGLIWIKLSCELFSNRKISKIRKMKNGDELALIWVFLLLLAARLNKGGRLCFKGKEGYTPTEIAAEGGFKEERVIEAIRVFLELDMIKEKNGVYKIKNWQKYQKNEQYERAKAKQRERVQRFRKNRKERVKNATLPITEEEIKKLKIQINEYNLEHYFEVIRRGISEGREYDSVYRAIVAMATRDKKRKIDENVNLTLRGQYQDERLLLPEDELFPHEIAFKHALCRSYEKDGENTKKSDTGGD